MQTTLPSLTPTRRLASLVALAALPLCGVAHADATASVRIDSFSYAVAGGGQLAWTGTDAYQGLSAQADDRGGLDGHDANQSDADRIADGTRSASTRYAAGTASAAADRTGSVRAFTLGSGTASTGQSNKAWGSLNQSDAFRLTGADSVTFNVGYTINVFAPNGNANDDFAEGALDFSAGSYLGTSGGSLAVEKYSFDALAGVGSYSGLLSWTVTLTGADDVGYYSLVSNAWAASPSAIPEPSEAALLLFGLGAVALRVRRRQTA